MSIGPLGHRSPVKTGFLVVKKTRRGEGLKPKGTKVLEPSICSSQKEGGRK